MVAGSEIAGEKKKCAQQDSRPRRDEDDQQITEHGKQVENQQCFFESEAVRKIAAGKSIQGGKQIVETVKNPYNDGTAAQGNQVNRQKPFGHPLSHAYQDYHEKHADGALL